MTMPQSSAAMDPAVETVLARLIAQAPHMAMFLTPHDPQRRLQLDSLDFVELLCVIEKEFSMRLTLEDLQTVTTVADLGRAIAERLGKEESSS